MSVRKLVKATVEVTPTQTPSGGESEWLERGDHPLLNDLVLETLFGFVRRYDLKACRGVSKKWNLHTIPQMRTHFIVQIPGSEYDEFLKLFRENLMGVPFAKFNLGAFPTKKVGKQFVKLFGETATEIEMEREKHAIEDVFQLFRSCPNLKVFGFPNEVISRSVNTVKLFPNATPTLSSLRKITFRMDWEDRLKFCPTYIKELMSAAPNFSHIGSESDFVVHYDDEEDSTISVILNEIEKQGKESSIQTLDLSYAVTDHIAELKRMAKIGLKLKSLTISFDPRIVMDNEINLNIVQIKIARMFKDTLQRFKVDQDVGNVLMEYPLMPKLKSLCLRLDHNTYAKPVNLNEKFPALETLDLGFDEFFVKKEWKKFFSRFHPCPTVKTLSLDRSTSTMRIQTFHHIQRVFPNVTKLELDFKDDGEEIFGRIWTQMTQLESLTISGVVEGASDFYLDSHFTGILTKTLKRINPVVNDFNIMTVDERSKRILALRNEHSRLPSIGNLSRLKYLALKVTVGVSQRQETLRSFSTKRMTYRLSDLTGYLAFHSMSHLRHLDVRACMFTKTCCEILTKETGLQSWSFQNEEWKNIIAPFVRHHEREKQYNH